VGIAFISTLDFMSVDRIDRMDGWMDGWMGRCIDRKVDGWMDG